MNQLKKLSIFVSFLFVSSLQAETFVLDYEGQTVDNGVYMNLNQDVETVYQVNSLDYALKEIRILAYDNPADHTPSFISLMCDGNCLTDTPSSVQISPNYSWSTLKPKSSSLLLWGLSINGSIILKEIYLIAQLKPAPAPTPNCGHGWWSPALKKCIPCREDQQPYLYSCQNRCSEGKYWDSIKKKCIQEIVVGSQAIHFYSTNNCKASSHIVSVDRHTICNDLTSTTKVKAILVKDTCKDIVDTLPKVTCKLYTGN